MTEKRWLWPALLCALVLGVYARAARFDFVYFDDNRYVTENEHVRPGLSWEGVKWAFGSRDDNYWHPLAFVSHMADVSLAGLTPGWPHAENALLHLANVLLLFFLLKRLTGEAAASAFVAAVFAIHPVQNETVAWIAERKSLLAALFALLAVRAYVLKNKWACAAFFALSLMAKPAAVGLPVVLLALDYWPLRRREPISSKAPLFALALLSCVVTRVSALKVAARPWPSRLSNVAVSHLEYLRTAVWPAGLEVFYRYPDRAASWGPIVLSLLLVCALSWLCWRERKRHPALLLGWVWFLALLEPSGGWVPVGAHARADRFLYLPIAGLALMAAFGLPLARRARPALAAAAVAALTVVASVRLDDWRDSVALFSRALSIDADSALIQMHLGFALFQEKRVDDAIEHLDRAVALEPDLAPAHNYLAIAQASRGRLDDARREFARALELDPATPFARRNLEAVKAAARR